MKVCCGASYQLDTYGVVEYGVFRRTPSLSNILESISWAQTVGFHAVELEAFTSNQLENVFSEVNSKIIKEHADGLGVRIPNFNVSFISSSLPEKSRFDTLTKEFSAAIKIAKLLGSDIISLVSPPYSGTKIANPSEDSLNRFTFSKTGEWCECWNRYVAWISKLTVIALEAGLKLAIEPRPREMISNSDAMLRLIDDVGSPNLGVLFDTAHHFVTKEILPVSIWKLGGRIFFVHMSDSDGVIEHHWSPGEGNIEWISVLKSLRDEKYEGYLAIDTSGIRKSSEDIIEAKQRVEDWLGQIVISEVSKSTVKRQIELVNLSFQ